VSISSRRWRLRTGSTFLWFGTIRKRSKYWTTAMARMAILKFRPKFGACQPIQSLGGRRDLTPLRCSMTRTIGLGVKDA
jgi:hypothetical protein